MEKYIYIYTTLAGEVQWIEYPPGNQTITGLIPGQGTRLVCRPGFPEGGM